jgi:hypothetical protein
MISGSPDVFVGAWAARRGLEHRRIAEPRWWSARAIHHRFAHDACRTECFVEARFAGG